MANPTFNGAALTSDAARNQIGSRQVRANTETLPGVDGLFVQPHGFAGRPISVTGLLAATGVSAALARTAVMDAFRTREQLADGATVAAFVGTDGCTYSNCLLQSYTHAAIQVSQQGAGNFAAYLPVAARLLQLTP
jgi:hypothetical protein